MKIPHTVLRIWRVVGSVFLVLFVAYMIYDHAINAPKAALVQQELEQEFNSIKPMPSTVACDYYASHKTQQSLVGGKYSTKLSYREIRTYYDAELSSHGWRFQKEEGLRDWGRDFGGRSAHYCKGSYTASLEYAGEKAGHGWDYALDMSWGLGSLVDKWRGDTCH